jgi:hypothetical protein
MNWLKDKEVFDHVEPPLSSGKMLLVSTVANKFKAEKLVSTVIPDLFRRAPTSAVDKLFRNPAFVHRPT